MTGRGAHSIERGRFSPFYRSVALGPERIVFGEPNLVSLVLARLESNAPAEIDLGAWRALRAAHVASAGLLLPRDPGDLVSNPIAQMMLVGALRRHSR